MNAEGVIIQRKKMIAAVLHDGGYTCLYEKETTYCGGELLTAYTGGVSDHSAFYDI